MKQLFLFAVPAITAFGNDFDTNGKAFVPEVWAQESLINLEENMVATNLVHRGFENVVASYGDVVNTRRPGEFVAKRKIDSDNVTVQDATAENVQVRMNQHLHTSFLIKDGEMSRSFKDLTAEYLTPAVQSLARAADQVVLNQVHQFQSNSVGKLGTDLTKSTVIAANTLMNTNKVPNSPGLRRFLLTPNAEGALLNVADFTRVNEAGDGGQALVNASIGRKFGFDFFMCQNTPSVPTGQTVQLASINNGNIAKGSTVLTINDTSATFLAGQWITVAGDMTPQMILSATGTPTTSITITPGLKSAVVNDAVVTVYPYGQVDLSAGYDAGWVKDIVTKTFVAGTVPVAGQMLTHGTTTLNKYGVIGDPETTLLSLDREVQTAMANNDRLNVGPAGEYCFAFHPNAVAFVSRPLAIVPSQFGARQAVASYNGLSMRVSMQYDGNKQGLLTTVDMLCGVKVLDTRLGCVIYG